MIHGAKNLRTGCRPRVQKALLYCVAGVLFLKVWKVVPRAMASGFGKDGLARKGCGLLQLIGQGAR